jgi:hypothetical protein
VTRLAKIILLLIAVQSVNAQADPATEVLDMDKKLNQLIIQNNAHDAEELYDDDFILITAGGSMKTKKDIVAEIGSSNLKITVKETIQTKVRVYGNAAVLTGILLQRGSYNGKEFDVKLLVTDTWIKTNSGWKILSGHASKVPTSSPAK